jgi:hypothetical protein
MTKYELDSYFAETNFDEMSREQVEQIICDTEDHIYSLARNPNAARLLAVNKSQFYFDQYVIKAFVSGLCLNTNPKATYLLKSLWTYIDKDDWKNLSENQAAAKVHAELSSVLSNYNI